MYFISLYISISIGIVYSVVLWQIVIQCQMLLKTVAFSNNPLIQE